MKNSVINNGLKHILQAYPDGISVESLKAEFNGSDIEFLSQAQTLWNEGHLTGIAKEGCCEDVCKTYCVSYMREKRIWKFV